jgi:serine/threonine protein phosphatase PrpC
MAENTSFRWSVIGGSVSGASHQRLNLPNQDAVFFNNGIEGNPPIVLAVADGHGSAKCFRSNIGAQLAVKVAVETTSTFIARMQGSSAVTVKDAAGRLSRDIVKDWIQAVDSHYLHTPLSEEELYQLGQIGAKIYTQAEPDNGNHRLAYGTTLLLAAFSDSYGFYLQIGDGDILAISGDSNLVEKPLGHDTNMIANETNSLCMNNAARLFRYRFQLLQEGPPSLVMLSTDGYSNSFSKPEGYLQAGSDILDLIHAEGLDYVQQNLSSWLADSASDMGSGDDVTLGLIYRLD